MSSVSSSRARRLYYELRNGHPDADVCPTDLSFLCCLTTIVTGLDPVAHGTISVLGILKFLVEHYGTVGAKRIVMRACGCGATGGCNRQVPLNISEFSLAELGTEVEAYGLLSELCCSPAALKYAFEAIEDGRAILLAQLALVSCCAAPVLTPSPETEIKKDDPKPQPVPQPQTGGDCVLPEPPKDVA